MGSSPESSKKKRGRPKRIQKSSDSIQVESMSENLPQINEDDYLFYVKTNQTSAIKSLFESLKPFNDGKQILEFALDGIHSFNTYTQEGEQPKALVQLFRNDFTNYYVKQPMKIIIDTESLLRVLRNFTSEQYITFAVEDPGDDSTPKYFLVILDGIKCKVVTRNKIKMEVSEIFDPQTIDTMSGSQKAIISSGLFNTICKNMSTLDKFIEFEKYEGKLLAKCGREDVSQEVEIPGFESDEDGEALLVDLDQEDIIHVKFLISHITRFAKCINLSVNVTLFFGNNQPLIIESQVGILGNIKILIPSAA